ncbi:pumilio domain-containing protein [Colletotrichum tofieldiae]|nr:pumilio domain-containing protein [Colletotrichum tofieldiae]
MANGQNEKPAPAVAPGFGGSNLYSQNIWNPTYGGAAKRDTRAGPEDAFPGQPSGSSALRENSEAETWGQSPWNQDTQTRTASGSASPNRTRDSLHSTTSFFENNAVGQGRALINGRPKSYLEEDKENTGFGPSYNSPFDAAYARQEKRGSKDNAYLSLGVVGAPSRDSSIPPRTNNRAFMANGRQMDDADLASQFKKSLTLDEAQSLAAGAQNFQFNPVTQPWRADVAAGDAYADAMAQYLPHKRGSVAGGSGQYRVVTSPKTFVPQPSDPWAQRQSSRDLRMVPDGDRRTPVPAFMQAQAPAPNFAGQYPPQMFDPYGRPSLPLPGYGLHMAPYSIPGVMPVRPAKDQDPGKGVRSLLLEEFRSSSKSNKRYELKDIYGHVVEFSGDQHGSRFIQQKLETANSDEKDQVFREIEPNAIQLMKDVFGNYVIQKFFEHGNQVQKKVLASQMKGKVVDLSMQMYACRVVQKALEHVLVEQQAELVKELEPEILKVVKDQNGNHVVQKIIELVPRQYIDFVMDSFRGQVSQLAAHMYACRVIQRMLEYGTEQDKETILAELHNSTQVLITDQYGNYVVQHIIEHGKPEDRSRIIQLVIAQLVTLSKHKFASNVVEKCIQYGSAEERKGIREQIISQSADGTSSLQLMMKDQYGNYVIQKLLNQLDGPEREAFVEEMRPQFNTLRKTSTSRQLAAIDRLIYATQTPPSNPQSSSPPSTSASAVGEVAEDDSKVGAPGGVSLKVEVDEA